MNHDEGKLDGANGGMLSGLFGALPPIPKTPLMMALENDRRIGDLASYVVSKGATVFFNNNPDDIERYRHLLIEKFKEMKQMIQRGTFTIDELEVKIADEYGAVNAPRTTVMRELDAIEYMEKNPEKK